MTEFESVANGSRSRARWRCAQGWIRADRLSESHLRLRGPRAELLRLWSQLSGSWDCLRIHRSDPPVHPHDSDGQYELLLVRSSESMRPPPRPSGLTATERR